MTADLIIKGATVYGEKETYENGFIRIQGSKISGIGRAGELPDESGECLAFPEHFSIVPGFIDIHVHGAGGADTMDGTAESLEKMGHQLTREGTTAFLATTMTQSKTAIEAALENAGSYAVSAPGKAEMLGIHLEGPFISVEKAGAQPAVHMLKPDITLFKRWQDLAKNRIRLVTLAPEEPDGMELVEYLAGTGVIASLGHTNATFRQTMEAVDAGAEHATHLFNQMRGLHHREPGVVGAVFDRKELTAELIVDGVHVAPEVVRLAYRQKGKDKLILITDAIRAKGLTEGVYDLGGQDVNVNAGKAFLPDGTLAGSVLEMDQAIHNMLTFTDASFGEVLQMVSANPARQLGVQDRKGSLAIGKEADVVVLDENHKTILTVCKGTVAYRREEE